MHKYENTKNKNTKNTKIHKYKTSRTVAEPIS